MIKNYGRPCGWPFLYNENHETVARLGRVNL